jgi:hypothetical protein
VGSVAQPSNLTEPLSMTTKVAWLRADYPQLAALQMLSFQLMIRLAEDEWLSRNDTGLTGAHKGVRVRSHNPWVVGLIPRAHQGVPLDTPIAATVSRGPSHRKVPAAAL